MSQENSVYRLKTVAASASSVNPSTMNDLGDVREEPTHRKRIIQTVVDFIVIILIFVIFILVYVLFDPKVRAFTCNQDDIWYPYKADTIPFWSVGLYGTVGPILFIILVELVNAKFLPLQKNKNYTPLKERRRRFFICTFHALSLFILGIALTLCLTEIGKRWVGRLRPHFYQVCNPDPSQINCSIPALSGVIYLPVPTDTICRGSAADVKEARLSFPSGHSSYSSYCMLFLIIYLEARLFLLQLRYVKPLIQLAALSAAWVTALSRISDYHHRGTDVLGGSILGIGIALFVTLIVGRVLWTYESKERYDDFDQKPAKMTRSF